MQALHEKYKQKGFLVLGVSIDRAKTEEIIDYVKRMGITFPNVHDTTFESARNYQVRGVPTTFIIDVKGRAIGVAVGLRSWMSEDSQKLVQQLLMEAK